MKRTHDNMIEGGPPDACDDVHIDSDDETDRVPPYDAKKEPRPQCKLYAPEYQEIRDNLQKCVELLEAPFKDTSFSSGSTKGLQEELKRRVKNKLADKVKIGVVGDMKSGKSSVINSILSVGVIARQGDAGSSCTWVVNEFCYRLPNQSQMFAAEVYFFSVEQRHSIIKGLVAEYHRASARDLDSSGGEKDAEQSVDDFATMQTVVTALRALFIDHPAFATAANVHDFLSNATCEEDDSILAHLYSLADQLMLRCLEGYTSIRVEAATPQALLLHLGTYQCAAQESDGYPRPSLWPFVNHIKFGLDCELLKSVTLVDLPGLSDANKTRAATSISHLSTCTHYMVVAEIGRATDDKFIREHLRRGFVTRGSGNTFLVLTHADNIDDATEVEMTRKGQQQLDAYETQIEVLERKRKDIISKIRKTPRGDQQYALMDSRDQTTAELKETRAKHKELRIHMRGRNICRSMQQIYNDLTFDPLPLAVYCVGNAAYKKHQAGYGVDDANPPTLSVQGTQIPLLREHLFLAPAAGKLNETKNQSTIQLEIMVRSFKLYATKTHMARKDEIERIVLRPQQMVSSVFDNIFNQLKTEADEIILDRVRDEEMDWTSEAQTLCTSWARSYSTAKHLAMLKSDGVHKGRTKGSNSMSWNGELLDINNDEIRAWGKEFLPCIKALANMVEKEVSQLVNSMLVTISRDEQVAIMALRPFLDYVAAEKHAIRPLVDNLSKSLRNKFGNIMRSTLGEDPNNPLVRAMAPVYAKAREIKGKKGGPKLRLATFVGMVTKQGNGVWAETHELFKKDLYAMFDKQADDLKKSVTAYFDGIAQKFAMTCAEGEESEEEAEFRRQVEKNLVLVDESMEKELLPMAKKFFED